MDSQLAFIGMHTKTKPLTLGSSGLVPWSYSWVLRSAKTTRQANHAGLLNEWGFKRTSDGIDDIESNSERPGMLDGSRRRYELSPPPKNLQHWE